MPPRSPSTPKPIWRINPKKTYIEKNSKRFFSKILGRTLASYTVTHRANHGIIKYRKIKEREEDESTGEYPARNQFKIVYTSHISHRYTAGSFIAFLKLI